MDLDQHRNNVVDSRIGDYLYLMGRALGAERKAFCLALPLKRRTPFTMEIEMFML